MTAAAQFALFLSSYAPLFGVFALLDSFGRGVPTQICVGVVVLGLVMPLLVLAPLRRLSPQLLHVESTQARDGDVLAYVATYLVPFAAVSAHSGRERTALAIFVLIVALLYVRAEVFYVNPLLAAVGYRLFQVVTPEGASVVLITRRRFVPAASVTSARRLSGYVYWETKP